MVLSYDLSYEIAPSCKLTHLLKISECLEAEIYDRTRTPGISIFIKETPSRYGSQCRNPVKRDLAGFATIPMSYNVV